MNNTIMSNAKTMQNFVTIIMGVGFSNLLQQYVVGNRLNDGVLLVDLKLENVTFLGVVFLFIRFYHGNIRLLSLSEVDDEGCGHSQQRFSQTINWVIVLVQALLFSVLGFFIKDLVNLNYVIIAAFLVDIVWVVLLYVSPDKVSGSVHTRWAILNVLSMIVIGIIQFMYIQSKIDVDDCHLVIGVTLLLSSIIDYWSNSKFYFPATNTNPVTNSNGG